MPQILTVSDVNGVIKLLLDNEPLLTNICVRGELSNYKIYPSGHHYFTIKDEQSSLKCVMFKSAAMKLRFKPESGMKVILTGRISVYSRDGVYQLYCESITPDGVGDLHIAFEQLKKKLESEGLFDAALKKPIPHFPHKIAIITSSAGAAIRDMLRILDARYPLAKVILLPVRVQGEQAPAEIAGALRYANLYNIADVIITGRGGGSIEDLWAFNDERVARAIFESEIPVISAVGHEPDVTISDYVADLRASTPSNAAELVAPDISELRIQIGQSGGRMQRSVTNMIKARREQLASAAMSRVLQSPMNYIDDRRLQLDYLRQRMASSSGKTIDNKKREFVRLAATLDALSPLKVLSRGYSIVKKPDGEIVKSYASVKPGDRVDIGLSDGSIVCMVDSCNENS